jgi:deoxyribose-phosphate aldolase
MAVELVVSGGPAKPAPDDHDRLRNALEATRLTFGLTGAEVLDVVHRALDLGVRGVCVPPQFVPVAVAGAGRGGGESSGVDGGEPGGRSAVAGAARELRFDIVTVANFPTGDHPVSLVERVAAEAVGAGANHVDLVVPGGMVSERDWRGVAAYLRRVRDTMSAAADHPVSLKVILETAAWDPVRLRGAAQSAIDAGADWLKTSTGFHPAGGATPEVVSLLRSLAPPEIGIKASGGIRTRDAALAMLDAGADRIGTSSEVEILS